MTERNLQRPALSEQPQQWRRFWIFRPNHEQVLNTYDQWFERLQAYGQTIESRVANDEQLSDQETISLIDARAAFSGRRNVNAADVVTRIKRQEAKGAQPTPDREEIKVKYQTGKFQDIDTPNLDQPFRYDIAVDRFTYPVEDENQSFAIKDGTPVEGMISFIDREIQEVKNRRLGVKPYSWPFDKIGQLWDLRNLRSQRNLLFTASSRAFNSENSVFHARNQIEAYADYLDPIRSGGQTPDWFNAEKFLRERRILNIPPRGPGENWLIGAIPTGIIAGIPYLTYMAWRALQPEPAPVIFNQVNSTDACYDVEGGTLRLQNFDLNNDPNPSPYGHFQREYYYALSGLSHRDIKPTQAEDFGAKEAQAEQENPGLIEIYAEIARQDAERTAKRIVGENGSIDPNEPFIRGVTEYERDHALLVQCLPIGSTLEKAKATLASKP